MKFRGDYHIHSVYSDGRATLDEIAQAAFKGGLSEAGVADHGPRNIGTGVKDSKTFLEIKDRLQGLEVKYPGLRLYAGAEANVVNPGGMLDLDKKIIDHLDYLLVGLHPYVLPGGISGAGWILANLAVGNPGAGTVREIGTLRRRVRNQNTKALVEAIFRHDVAAITHPGLKMEIDIPETARACVSKNTAWEINCGHEFPGYDDVLEAARCGVDFIVNSDAHYVGTVGLLQYGSRILAKAGVAADRVRNAIKGEGSV